MNLLKIGNTSYNRIVKYSQSFEQLWKDGSGRSPYTGVWNGQILGNFEPIKVTLQVMTKEELSFLVKTLKKGSISVTHYDIETMGEKTATFYRANYSVDIKQFYDDGQYQTYGLIDIELIPHKPS